MSVDGDSLTGASRVAGAIARGREREGVALVSYVTAGYPSRAAFGEVLGSVMEVSDVVEVGVPFSDPMADGVTIQDASRVALSDGVNVDWILESVGAACGGGGDVPVVLMSYLNPLMRFGLDRLASCAGDCGVSGLIVPDLPVDESAVLGGSLRDAGLGMVQMATPVTSEERLGEVVRGCSGFLYAVTSAGTTGRSALDVDGVCGYLDGLRERVDGLGGEGLGVCAGFGIRSAAQVESLRGHCDGVIVGSALVERIRDGGDAAGFLRSLRG